MHSYENPRDSLFPGDGLGDGCATATIVRHDRAGLRNSRGQSASETFAMSCNQVYNRPNRDLLSARRPVAACNRAGVGEGAGTPIVDGTESDAQH
jgi:hypothetical protein